MAMNPNFRPNDDFNYPVSSSTYTRPTGPSVGQVISAGVTATDWNAVIAFVNNEIARRTPSPATAGTSITNVAQDAIITAADFNRVNNALRPTGTSTGRINPQPDASRYYRATIENTPSGAPAPGTVANFSTGALVADVADGTLITASRVQSLLNALFTASRVCLCNCNYCTCNCNYCTCNCNYSCTCNCNYSDIRLKENIIFERSESGINLYSWSYIWDKTTKYIGVLAQELVGTKYSDALLVDDNGYYLVDYTKLPVSMTQI